YRPCLHLGNRLLSPFRQNVIPQPPLIASTSAITLRHFFCPIECCQRVHGNGSGVTCGLALHRRDERLCCLPRGCFGVKLAARADPFRSSLAVLPPDEMPSATAFVEHYTSKLLSYSLSHCAPFAQGTDG